MTTALKGWHVVKNCLRILFAVSVGTTTILCACSTQPAMPGAHAVQTPAASGPQSATSSATLAATGGVVSLPTIGAFTGSMYLPGYAAPSALHATFTSVTGAGSFLNSVARRASGNRRIQQTNAGTPIFTELVALPEAFAFAAPGITLKLGAGTVVGGTSVSLASYQSVGSTVTQLFTQSTVVAGTDGSLSFTIPFVALSNSNPAGATDAFEICTGGACPLPSALSAPPASPSLPTTAAQTVSGIPLFTGGTNVGPIAFQPYEPFYQLPPATPGGGYANATYSISPPQSALPLQGGAYPIFNIQLALGSSSPVTLNGPAVLTLSLPSNIPNTSGTFIALVSESLSTPITVPGFGTTSSVGAPLGTACLGTNALEPGLINAITFLGTLANTAFVPGDSVNVEVIYTPGGASGASCGSNPMPSPSPTPVPTPTPPQTAGNTFTVSLPAQSLLYVPFPAPVSADNDIASGSIQFEDPSVTSTVSVTLTNTVPAGFPALPGTNSQPIIAAEFSPSATIQFDIPSISILPTAGQPAPISYFDGYCSVYATQGDASWQRGSVVTQMGNSFISSPEYYGGVPPLSAGQKYVLVVFATTPPPDQNPPSCP